MTAESDTQKSVTKILIDETIRRSVGSERNPITNSNLGLPDFLQPIRNMANNGKPAEGKDDTHPSQAFSRYHFALSALSPRDDDGNFLYGTREHIFGYYEKVGKGTELVELKDNLATYCITIKPKGKNNHVRVLVAAQVADLSETDGQYNGVLTLAKRITREEGTYVYMERRCRTLEEVGATVVEFILGDSGLTASLKSNNPTEQIQAMRLATMLKTPKNTNDLAAPDEGVEEMPDTASSKK